jgi:hypothetical protein
MADEPETSKQDLDTLLQHLRNVHLTFVLAATAIFMALSSSNTVFEVAIQQLRDVVQLADIITSKQVSESVAQSAGKSRADQRGLTALESFVESSLSEYFEAMEIHPESLKLQFLSVDMQREEFGYLGSIDDFREFQAEQSWLQHSLALLSDGESIYTSTYYLFGESFNTVDGHRARLDRILAADRLYLRPSFHGPYFSRSTAIAERYPGLSEDERARLNEMSEMTLSVTLESIELTDARSRDVFAESQGHVQSDPVGYDDYDFRFDEMRLKCWARAAGADPLSFDLVLSIMFRVEQPNFVADALRNDSFDEVYYARYLSGVRSFDRLFPELMQVSSLLVSLTPNALERYLEDQKQKSGAPISVLGLQVSRDLIEVWGVLLMLGIQLYFCMHYRTLLDRAPEKRDIAFPWIGVYRYWLSSLVFQASVALPLIVTLFAVFWHRDGVGMDLYGIALAAIALSMFVWSERTYVGFWKRLR